MSSTSAADEQGDLTVRPAIQGHGQAAQHQREANASQEAVGDAPAAGESQAPPPDAALPAPRRSTAHTFSPAVAASTRPAGPPGEVRSAPRVVPSTAAPSAPPVVPPVPPPVVPPVAPPRVPPKAAQATAVAAPAISGHVSRRGREWRQLLQSTATSAVVHASLLIALGLLLIEVPATGTRPSLTATAAPQDNPRALVWWQPPQNPGGAAEAALDAELPLQPAVELSQELDAVAVLGSSSPGKAAALPPTLGLELPPGESPLERVRTDLHGLLAGRSPQSRGALLEAEGGTPQSEAAVLRGLRWLAAHQQRDGSWNFNHHLGACAGRCRDPGTHASTTAATALALLAFLGHGETHREGEFSEIVRAGLYYLLNRGAETPHGLDLQEGTMYAQGLAAMALCEAYALTQDRGLQQPAQRALDFIVYAQDKQGGGWRYAPGMPGDTTVTGWQLMALRSGQMAYLVVPEECLAAAARFLDSVQDHYGAYYGYQTPDRGATTTAIGLLCRMYQGWERQNESLATGVALLASQGPSPDNMYYNYYATQVLHHWGGEPWNAWNQSLRERLIADQAREGHESGSWHYTGGRAAAGGRLYNTAMAVMTLEVYYRHLPLYRDAAVSLGREE